MVTRDKLENDLSEAIKDLEVSENDKEIKTNFVVEHMKKKSNTILIIKCSKDKKENSENTMQTNQIWILKQEYE